MSRAITRSRVIASALVERAIRSRIEAADTTASAIADALVGVWGDERCAALSLLSDGKRHTLNELAAVLTSECGGQHGADDARAVWLDLARVGVTFDEAAEPLFRRGIELRFGYVPGDRLGWVALVDPRRKGVGAWKAPRHDHAQLDPRLVAAKGLEPFEGVASFGDVCSLRAAYIARKYIELAHTFRERLAALLAEHPIESLPPPRRERVYGELHRTLIDVANVVPESFGGRAETPARPTLRVIDGGRHV